MVKIAQPITADWVRAVARAAEDRAAGRIPERIAVRTYRVPSSRDGELAHTVLVNSVINLDATCDCDGAAHGRKCRHAAAALCEAARRIQACEREQPAPAARPALARVSPEAFAARFAA